ncbi:MAG: hypothetical protein ACT4ON_13565 [Bacteroidota bacterium]
MQLHYFSIKDTPEILKSKRNALVKKHHPDKAPEHLKAAKTEIMKHINSEYDFLLKEYKRPKVQDKSKHSQYTSVNKKATEQAQNIFHALTQFSSINYLLLFTTVIEINDWEEVSKAYSRMYGISTLKHFKKTMPTSKVENLIKLILKLQNRAVK